MADLSHIAWTNPATTKPPLHTQVLVALKDCPGGKGDVLDVACFIGAQKEPDGEVERWIGTGNRFETRQLAGWMTIETMADVAWLHLRIKQLEAAHA